MQDKFEKLSLGTFGKIENLEAIKGGMDGPCEGETITDTRCSSGDGGATHVCKDNYEDCDYGGGAN